ncbi:MAG: hypothetical protein QOE58_427, partial [Actinomycetota bacterium]|nr:hypothetical protein [Actinomycetota bacterium]
MGPEDVVEVVDVSGVGDFGVDDFGEPL